MGNRRTPEIRDVDRDSISAVVATCSDRGRFVVVGYGRLGKCLGFIRTLPSHPHIAFVQRNRLMSHSTLTTRSSALRGIRRAVLPQSGHCTDTPTPALS